jgi:hypothetical protein
MTWMLHKSQILSIGAAILLAAIPVYAQDSMGPERPEDPAVEEATKADNYEVCAAFNLDPDADLGDIINAGCKPSLAQMSALMDNPIGNVAMMFNQFDVYQMEDPISGTEEPQGNYMMLFQFPKKLNDNWNLINRVILNVPSVPLDQDKIDDFTRDFDYGTGPGDNPLTPPGSQLPVDLFSGRTTGFGDAYYVGLFAPNKPTELSNGAKFLWAAGYGHQSHVSAR